MYGIITVKSLILLMHEKLKKEIKLHLKINKIHVYVYINFKKRACSILIGSRSRLSSLRAVCTRRAQSTWRGQGHRAAPRGAGRRRPSKSPA
jgi:hypothetical protein